MSNPFEVGDCCGLHKSARSKKIKPFYESGWVVANIVDNVTCDIRRKTAKVAK